MYELLQLENFKDFSCIGDKCSDTCCHSWRVFINKATYKKYKKSKNIKIDNLVIVDKNSSSTYAEVKFREDGYCPYLNDKGLCDIHKDYGRNMLSDVCRIYPQELRRFNNRLERSIKLSCPAGIDLLFKSKDPLEFNLSIENKSATVITINEDGKINDSFTNEGYFLFRSLAITVLQDRDFSIKERLYILGKISTIVSNLVECKEYKTEEIVAYIKELETSFKTNESFRLNNENRLTDKEKDEVIFKIIPILKDLFNKDSNKNKTFVYDILNKGVDNIKDITLDEIKNFKSNVLDRFFLENEYVIEHYMVYKLFDEAFPKNSASIENAFNMTLNKFLMLYLYLIITYKDYDTINIDDFKNVLYFFERNLSHSGLKKMVVNNLNNYIKADWELILEIMF